MGDDRAKTSSDAAYERKKRVLVLALAALVVGLAFAGSLERGSAGPRTAVAGAAVFVAWMAVAFALHQLGRQGRP